MSLDPEDIDLLGGMFDKKLKVFGEQQEGERAALLGQVESLVKSTFQRELATAQATLSRNGKSAHRSEDVIPGLNGDGGGEGSPPPTGRALVPQPAGRPVPKGNPATVLASSLLTAIEADPVGAVGALLDKAFETFVKFRSAVAPHPYDQALKLMEQYPQVTALWAPNPLGPWQQQVLAQSMLLGANAAKQMKGEMLFPQGVPPSPGNAILSPTPSAAPTSPSSGPSPSSTGQPSGPSPAPPGFPQGAPAVMQSPDLARFAKGRGWGDA